MAGAGRSTACGSTSPATARHRRRGQPGRSPPGEVVGLVGESGSGKTTVGLAVLGHARKGVRVVQGSVSINGREMLDPQAPAAPAGQGRSGSPTSPRTRARRSTRRCASASSSWRCSSTTTSAAPTRPAATGSTRSWPRCSCRRPGTSCAATPISSPAGNSSGWGWPWPSPAGPAVIVLDEPTTGLDVSTQAHVLETVRDLCRRHGVAALYVTHDLAVVANLADRVAVMYAGRVVESGPTTSLFDNPAHPYSRHLIAAAPDITGQRAIVGLAGRAPSPGRRPVGCAFAPRCELATEECTTAFPPVVEVAAGHDGPLRAAVDGAGADGGRPRLPARTDRSGRRHARRAVGFGVLRRPPGRAGHRPPRREGRVPGAGR